MNKKICSSFVKDPAIYEFQDSINNIYIDDVNGSRTL